MLSLRETLTFDQAGIVVETKDEHNGKSLYMKGICIQGGVKNANQRVYPVNESRGLSAHLTIKSLVDTRCWAKWIILKDLILTLTVSATW